MKRALVLGTITGVLVAAVAVAYPPATLEPSVDSITVGNLDCGTRYRIRVEERRGAAWQDRQLYTQWTDACPPPPPPDSDGDGVPDVDDQCPTEAGPPPTGCPEPPPGGFPNRSTTGVPDGWVPQQTRNTSLTVTTPGAVVEDIRFTDGAGINVAAANVRIRRVELEGGRIETRPNGICPNGVVIEDVTLEPRAGLDYNNDTEGVISPGGYTARGVEIWHRSEGFRVGGNSDGGCGPVRIEDSFVDITPPQPCGDWHGDGIQGYDGPALTARNVTIDFHETGGCGGTSPFFMVDNQGNTSADIERMLVKGGGWSFRLAVPGSVTQLKVVDGSWYYGPVDVDCSLLSHWDAEVVTIDAAYQPTTVRNLPC